MFKNLNTLKFKHLMKIIKRTEFYKIYFHFMNSYIQITSEHINNDGYN